MVKKILELVSLGLKLLSCKWSLISSSSEAFRITSSSLWRRAVLLFSEQHRLNHNCCSISNRLASEVADCLFSNGWGGWDIWVIWVISMASYSTAYLNLEAPRSGFSVWNRADQPSDFVNFDHRLGNRLSSCCSFDQAASTVQILRQHLHIDFLRIPTDKQHVKTLQLVNKSNWHLCKVYARRKLKLTFQLLYLMPGWKKDKKDWFPNFSGPSFN